MRKSSQNKEKREKKCKTKKKLQKADETENTNEGEDGAQSILANKPKRGKDEAQPRDKWKAPQKGARKALHKAVTVAVKARSAEIALSLLDRTAKGDMRGAAMMISLMEPMKKDGEEGKSEGSGPSLAELLESEPPWNESMEKRSEAGMGRREADLRTLESSK